MRKHLRLKNLFRKLFHVGGTTHAPDYTLITITLILVLFGLLMLMSASSVVSYQKFKSSYYLFWHQILSGFLPGIILFWNAAGAFVGLKKTVDLLLGKWGSWRPYLHLGKCVWIL